MSAIFAADTAAIFNGPLAVDAVYTPAGGAAMDVRVVPLIGDATQAWSGGSYVADAGVFLVRIAEIADPSAGATLAVSGGGSFTVQGAPVRDPRGLTWRLEARPT